jgi:PAS domain S-box-containing protein
MTENGLPEMPSISMPEKAPSPEAKERGLFRKKGTAPRQAKLRTETPPMSEESTEGQVRMAKSLALIWSITMFVAILVLGYIAINSKGQWQIFVYMIDVLLMGLYSLIAYVVARRGNALAAAGILLYGVIFTYLLAPIVAQSTGLVGGVLIPVFTAAIALSLMPQRQALTALGISLVVAAASLFLEIFGSPWALYYLPIQVASMVIGTGGVLALTVLLVAQIPGATIQRRLIIAFIVLSIIPMAVIGGNNVVAGVVSANKEALNTLADFSVLNKDKIDLFIGDMSATLDLAFPRHQEQKLAGMLASQSNSPQDYMDTLNTIYDTIDDILEETPDFENIMFIAPNGRVLVTGGEAEEEFWMGENLSDRTYFIEGLKGEYISEAYFEEADQLYTFFLSRPFTDKDGQVVGVLVAEGNFQVFNELLTEERRGLGESGETYLVSSDYLLTTGSRFEGYGIGSQAHTEGVITAFEARGEVQGTYENYTGNPVLGDYRWIPDINAVLATEITQSEISKAAFQDGAISIAIGLVITAAALLGSLVISRGISIPLVKLLDTTRRIAAGDYTATADIESQDELGELAKSFNAMTKEVSERSQELARTLDGLEQTIQERTKELDDRARELEASQRVTFAASERTTPEDFLNLLVNLIVDQFDVYHCQIYLVDGDGKNAVLKQSTGYAGRQLLQRGHSIPLDQESLVTLCINAGEPVLEGDVADNPGWLPNPLLPHTRSELVMPLKIEEEVIGALDIQDRVANRFTERTVPVFATMTEHVASLFQTTELLDEIEKRTGQIEQTAKQLRIAAEIAERLNTITDLEQLLEEAVNELQTRFGFYHAHIYLLDKSGENLVVQAGSGHIGLTLKREKHSIPLSREASLVARAGRARQPIVASDVQTEEGFMPNPMLPNTRSEASIPLVSGERLLGVLDMQDERVDRFTQADVDTLTTLAGQMASAIESAELFGQVELERAQAETLYEISNKLNAAQSKQEILQILSETAIKSGAGLANLISLTVDEQGSPEWAEVEASYRVENLVPEIRSMAVGERFYAPDIPHFGIWIADQHSARLIANVKIDETLDDASREMILRGGVQSLVIIPLSQAGTWLGFILLNWSAPHAFSPTEVQVYNSLIGLGSQAFASQKLLEAQRESEARYRTLVENAPEAIVVLDADSGLFIEANQNAADLYGFATPEELIGKHPAADLSPAFQPDGRPSMEAAGDYITEAAEGGTPVFEWMHKTSEGVDIPCEVRLVRLPGGARPMVRASVTDITDRKSAEETIIQGDRLKSEFLANMSHELRTPLNSIIGYTDVLILGVDGEVNGEVMKDLQAINENSKTLLRLIDDILDLAKIEAGRMVLDLSRIDVRSMLEDLAKNNAGLLVNKPVELILEVEDNLPALKADHVRVVQMLNNLLSNAIKFTTTGEIILRANRDNHDFIRLEVEDTGVGISKKDLEVIFDEFKQADNSSTRTAHGSGLGLTITRRLVELHGGSIHVESEVGRGSTFTIRLPLEPNVPVGVSINDMSEKAPDEFFEKENSRKKEVTASLK